MAKKWCLTKQATDKFLEMLKNGEINPDELSEMISAERRLFFTKHFGEENAKNINSLFEEKLLLKNQKIGMITWAKKVSGLSEPAKRDLISRINRMEKFLDPKAEEEFLEDLAVRKLGLDVTREEASRIFEFSKKVDELKNKPNSQIEYGRALMDFHDYVNSLKPKELRLDNFAVNVGNLFKTLMSTLDVSMYFRQGWGMMSTKSFWKNFPGGLKYFASEEGYKNAMASIYGHPKYDMAKDAKLGITKLSSKLSEREEAFQSDLLDKLPLLRGSMRAYTGFLNKIRFDRFVYLVEKAEMAGEDVRKGSQTVKDIADIVNDFTGRGRIGKNDKYANIVPAANTLLFSPRKITATLSMMNPKTYIKGSPTARKAALRQIIGSLSITVGALSLATSLGLGVEKDPTSSDFGKVKIPGTNSRIDMTGGNGTYAVLLARLLAGKTKSTRNGKIYKIGEGYKPTTRLSLIENFSKNKLSPLASLAADLLVGRDWEGKPIDIKKELAERVKPLIISSVIDMANSGEEKDIVAILTLFELFGFGVQTYN